jgi:hypothetical protein
MRINSGLAGNWRRKMNLGNENAPAGTEAEYNRKLRSNYNPPASRMPAFGKQIMQMRLAGKMPKGIVMVTFGWEIAKAYTRIVIPDDLPTDQLNFYYLAGLAVQVVYHRKHADRVNDVADAVLKINPSWLATLALDLIDTGNALVILKAPELPQREAA